MCNFMLQTMYYARCARGCNSSPEASIHQSTLETHMITQSCSSIFLCCRDQFLAKNSVNRDDYLQLQRAENLAAFDLILKNVCKYCGIVTILFFLLYLSFSLFLIQSFVFIFKFLSLLVFLNILQQICLCIYLKSFNLKLTHCFIFASLFCHS